MNEDRKLKIPEIPFHSPEEKEEWYEFRCPKCGMLDRVPGFVVDEFAINQETKEGEMPGVACPNCNTEMKFVKVIEE